MTELAELIQGLQAAPTGTEELDQQVLNYHQPGWYVCGNENFHTRCLDAKFPDENVVRVERLTRRISERWRATLDNGWSAEGNTEPLARRLAWLTWHQSELGRQNPEPRKPRRDDKKRRALLREKPPEQDSAEDSGPLISPSGETNDKVIIQVLCDHIRRLKAVAPASAEPSSLPEASSGEMTILIARHPHFKPPPAQTRDSPGTLFSEVVEAWSMEARPTVKNLDRVRRAARRFIEMYGDRPMDSYTKAEVREFLSHIRNVPKWPPTKIRRMPLPVVLKYVEDNPGVTRVTPRTVRAYLKDLNLLFNWAMACDLCTINPGNNLRVVDRRIQSELRIAFDEEDLKLIFERSPMYNGCKAPHLRLVPGDRIIKDSVFWFPLLGLFSGARLTEMANSRVDDIKTDGEITYLDVHAAGDNRQLKTQSSDRRIPIHPELVRIGFLDFVQSLKSRGRSKIFEEVEGRRSVQSPQGWSQSWRVYQAGLDINDRRKVFYSFRHTFKRACRDAGIEEEIHDNLTGHRAYWSGRRYGQGVSLKMAAEAMAKVKYEGLDLSHLHVNSKSTRISIPENVPGG